MPILGPYLSRQLHFNRLVSFLSLLLPKILSCWTTFWLRLLLLCPSTRFLPHRYLQVIYCFLLSNRLWGEIKQTNRVGSGCVELQKEPVESGMDRLSISQNVQQDVFDWKKKAEQLLRMIHISKQHKDCRRRLEELLLVLPGLPTPQKLVLLDQPSEESSQFTAEYFRPILEALLNNWTNLEDDLLMCWIEYGPAEETLYILTETVQLMQPSRRRDQVTRLIEHLISSEAFVFSCLRPSFFVSEISQWEEDWLQPLSSLPDVLGNTLQRHLPIQLTPSCYCRSVAVQLARCIFILSEAMKNSFDVKVEPLALLVGHLCAKYGPDYLLHPLLELVDSLTQANFIARRIWTALVRSLDDRCLEQLLVHASQRARPTEAFQRLSGYPTFPLDYRWQRLLCSKLLFLRGLTDVRVGRNVLTLLAQHTDSLMKVTIDLLSVWSEKNALLLTSPQQHTFITQCLIMAFHLMPQEVLIQRRCDLHLVLKEGVNHHLESPQLSVRVLGMVTAEICTSRIQPDASIALKFSYDQTQPYVQQLQNLLEPEMEGQEMEEFETLLAKIHKQSGSRSIDRAKPLKTPQVSKGGKVIDPVSTNSAAVEELDSDDDLEPYDMSEDTVLSEWEAPNYIRDMMEMLGDSQNEKEEYDRMRLALSVAEEIIRQQLPLEHPSLVEPLLSILIHLQDKFSLPDFEGQRMRALIAVAVSKPVESASYLTREFYQINLSVVQRLDMLRIIDAVAEELSSHRNTKPPTIEEIVDSKPTQDQIIKQRLDAKTRRFFPSDSSRQQPIEYLNRFSSVSGNFFFPLAEKLDKSLVHLSLMDQDFILLSSLIRSLAIMLRSTGPVPVVIRMVHTIFDMVWILRLHREPSVREAVLAAFVQALLALTPSQLASDHSLEISDWKDWLLHSMERDPVPSVRSLAQQAVALLAHLLNDL